MIGLVVVTHGRLAEEFIAAAEHVVGHLDNARAGGRTSHDQRVRVRVESRSAAAARR